MKVSNIISFLFMSGLGVVSAAASANEFYTLTLTGGVEDNVPRVRGNPDAAESGFVVANFMGGKFIQLGANHSVTLAADMSSTRYFSHPGFDRIGVSASAGYTYKMGFGAYAPRIGASFSLGKEEMDGLARDRRLVTSAAFFEKRLSSYLSFSAGLDYQVSRGDSLPDDWRLASFGYDPDNRLPATLFDDDSSSVFAELAYDLPNGMLVTGGYSRTDGFTVASTQTPNLHVYKLSRAIYTDPAWPDLWFGYRLPAIVDDWSLGLSIPVLRDSSIGIGGSWQDVDGPDDLYYDNRLVTISFIHNF